MTRARALVVAAIVVVLCAVVAPTHAASPALGAALGSGAAHAGRRSRPHRGHRCRSAVRTDGLRPERRCVTPAGVGREARDLVHRAARARPALSLPYRGRGRRNPDWARLERQPPPRRVRRSDPHPGGSEPARTPRRGNWDQASRRSRARRRHVLRHATGRARLEAVLPRDRVAATVGALRRRACRSRV